MDTLERYGPLIGRFLIAFIFLFSGFGKITGFEGTIGFIASKGVPLPQFAAIAAIIVELGGGVMLVIGWNARIAAAAMLFFTAMAALIFHDFWAVAADQAQNQMIHFMKNVSMMGGLLLSSFMAAGRLA